MAAVNLGQCISSSIDDLKKDPMNHILASLLMGVVSSATGGLTMGPLMVGYVKMIEKQKRGEAISPTDIFKGFDDFVPALIASLLGGLAVGVGVMLCVIPGLLLAPLLPVSAYLIAQGEKDGVNALKRAFELLKPNLVMAAVTAFALNFVAGLGAIACIIGVVVTMPIASIGGYYLSRQLSE